MLVLILDRSHAVLCAGERVLEIEVDGPRPLRTVEHALAARGVPLPQPAGSRPRADGGRDFVFVFERREAPAGMAWRPLRDVIEADDEAWSLYVELVLGGWLPPTRALDVWAFGNTPEMAARLAHLVACGTKRATMAWIASAQRDGSPLPYAGGVSVVTDGFGFPRLVLRSTEVRELPFGAIDAATAACEGEGDLTHDDWREGHIAYFAQEARQHGLVFDDASLIAVEHFEVLHVVGRSAPGPA